jgi:hypothetical protein
MCTNIESCNDDSDHIKLLKVTVCLISQERQRLLLQRKYEVLMEVHTFSFLSY